MDAAGSAAVGVETEIASRRARDQEAAIGGRTLAGTRVTGDAQADFLIEQFVPGDVYHVDSIVYDSKVRFAVASRYETPPFQVAHEGGSS